MRRELALLSAAVRLGHRRGLIVYLPFLISLPEPPPRERIISVDDARRLLAACDEPYVRRFVLLCLHTLQRPGAIFDLRTDQVDFVTNQINFLPRGRLQVSKRRPIVRMTVTLRDEMTKAVADSKSGFVLEKGGIRLRSMRKAFASAVQRAGLNDVTPYVLRRSGASHMAASGVPMHQIASILGHTTQRTTEVYTKRRAEFQAEATMMLDEMFGVARVDKDVVPNQANPITERTLHSAAQSAPHCAPNCAPNAAQRRSSADVFRNAAIRGNPQKTKPRCLVDPIGIEPTTSTMPLWRSPS